MTPHLPSRSSKSPKQFCRDHGNMSNSTFYRLVREGKLRIVKAGGRTLVLDVDEAAWLATLQPFVPQAARQAA